MRHLTKSYQSLANLANRIRKWAQTHETILINLKWNSTCRLQGDNVNSTRLATRNEVMPITEAPMSDILRQQVLQLDHQSCMTLLPFLG